ncbi:MAG: gliding motility-associated C-terminal domain-containing protein [Flavobacteriales bacterium]|nr:gliding motility-associated C-terminal domain-containing protein [Flavobacteriales bacterium]
MSIRDKISLYVPDIFSPNGDGENDSVFVQGSGIQFVEQFIIYHRWGEKVIEHLDFQVISDENANKLNGWNGNTKVS